MALFKSTINTNKRKESQTQCIHLAQEDNDCDGR